MCADSEKDSLIEFAGFGKKTMAAAASSRTTQAAAAAGAAKLPATISAGLLQTLLLHL